MTNASVLSTNNTSSTKRKRGESSNARHADNEFVRALGINPTIDVIVISDDEDAVDSPTSAPKRQKLNVGGNHNKKHKDNTSNGSPTRKKRKQRSPNRSRHRSSMHYHDQLNDDDFLEIDPISSSISNSPSSDESPNSSSYPSSDSDSDNEDFIPNKTNSKTSTKQQVKTHDKKCSSDKEDKTKEQTAIAKEKTENLFEDKDEDPIIIDSSDEMEEELPQKDIAEQDADNNEATDFILSEKDEPLAKIPARMNAKLRPYQREGVKFLWNLYKAGKGGILGDDMGLGKTVQAIAFFAAILGEREKRAFSNKNSKTSLPRKQILLVTPNSVMQNWAREIRKWSQLTGSAFRVASYTGKDRKNIIASVKQGSIDILLTSYHILRTDIDLLNQVNWDCCVLDEIHQIKDRRAKLTQSCLKINTLKRFGLTGTLMQNDWDELHCLLSFVQPGVLSSLETFRIKFANPIKKGHRIDATSTEIAARTRAMKQLNVILKTLVLRRDKSVIRDLLPSKSDNIVFCPPTELQIAAYQRAVNSPEYLLLSKWEYDCECGFVLDGLFYSHPLLIIRDTSVRLNILETVADHPKKLASNEVNSVVNICPDDEFEAENKPKMADEMSNVTRGSTEIDLTAGTASMGFSWKRLVLPAITNLQKIATHLALLEPREDTKSVEKRENALQFFKIATGEDSEKIRELIKQNSVELSGKMKILLRLLEAFYSKGKKVLIFSQHTRTLDLISRTLSKIYPGKMCRLDGSTSVSERQTIIDVFNREPYTRKFIFLLSTKAGGVGLNISSASVVVVFEPSWNVSHDLQAQDRVHRLGQTQACEIYRLITKGSIEETIYNRQVYKQQMASMGTQARMERRYYKGVHGVKGQHGELFGIANLLRNYTDKNFTAELLKEAEEVYSNADAVIEIKPNALNASSDDVPAELGAEHEQVKALFSLNVDENDPDLKENHHIMNLDALEYLVDRRGPDEDIAQILRQAGVTHMHDNLTVVGHSLREEDISKRALQIHKDRLRMEEAQQRAALLASQSSLQLSPPIQIDLTASTSPPQRSTTHNTSLPQPPRFSLSRFIPSNHTMRTPISSGSALQYDPDIVVLGSFDKSPSTNSLVPPPPPPYNNVVQHSLFTVGRVQLGSETTGNSSQASQEHKNSVDFVDLYD